MGHSIYVVALQAVLTGYLRGTHVLYVGVLQAVLTYSHGSAATLIAEAISSHIAVNVRSRRQL